MTIGKIGYGVTLMVGATTAAVTATVLLGGLTNVPPPSFSREAIEVTNQSSPDATKEYIPGLRDPGELSMELNWEPGNATDDVLQTMTDENAPRYFEEVFTQVTPNRIVSFYAFLTGYEPGVPVEGKMTATITLRVTGKPIWADVV